MLFEFTIIIPVYNEEDNLIRLEEALLLYLKSSILPTKVLFVNDGSTDNSLNKIESICNRTNSFTFISFDKNYGLSAALKAGIDFSDTEFIGYIDADLQTSPSDFNLLLKYTNDYDLVTGVRTKRNDNFAKRLSSKTANSFRRAFTKDGIDDTGCPLKVIKSEYAKRIPMFKGLHRFLPALVILQGGTVKQVPVKHFPRLSGTSKFGISNRFFGPLTDCFVYLWMKKRYINYNVTNKKL